MTQRRTLLQTLAAIFPLSVLAKAEEIEAESSTMTMDAPGRDYYKELGVKPFINAAGASPVMLELKGMREDEVPLCLEYIRNMIVDLGGNVGISPALRLIIIKHLEELSECLKEH